MLAGSRTGGYPEALPRIGSRMRARCNRACCGVSPCQPRRGRRSAPRPPRPT